MLSVVLDVEQLPHTYVWNYKSTSVRHHESSTESLQVWFSKGRENKNNDTLVGYPGRIRVRYG